MHTRGAEWKELIERISPLPPSHPDVLSFMLMMVRLDGCMTCHADSYRAMRGCTLCAQQAISRFKGSDQELIAKWQTARSDIERWLQEGITPVVE
jgi:hypothetical protein